MVTLKQRIFGDKKQIGTAEKTVCNLCGRWDCPQMHSQRYHTYIGDGKWVLSGKGQ